MKLKIEICQEKVKMKVNTEVCQSESENKIMLWTPSSPLN